MVRSPAWILSPTFPQSNPTSSNAHTRLALLNWPLLRQQSWALPRLLTKASEMDHAAPSHGPSLFCTQTPHTLCRPRLRAARRPPHTTAQVRTPAPSPPPLPHVSGAALHLLWFLKDHFLDPHRLWQPTVHPQPLSPVLSCPCLLRCDLLKAKNSSWSMEVKDAAVVKKKLLEFILLTTWPENKDSQEIDHIILKQRGGGRNGQGLQWLKRHKITFKSSF